MATSVTVDTIYGTFFDEAIKEMFQDGHEDNRKNSPDNGILLQIGGKDIGCGDYARLIMKYKAILSQSIIQDKPNNEKTSTPAANKAKKRSPVANKKKRTPATNDESRCNNKKQA